MNERGVTIPELLVAAAIFVIVMVGAFGIYLFGIRVAGESQSQAFLQRQGTLILEELGQRVREAQTVSRVNSTNPKACWSSISSDAQGDALVVGTPTEIFCYYRDSVAQLVRCTFTPIADPDTGTCDLFYLMSAGSPATIAASTFSVIAPTQCEVAGSTCTAGFCSDGRFSCAAPVAARISFTLTDGTANAPMQFNATFTTSRHQ